MRGWIIIYWKACNPENIVTSSTSESQTKSKNYKPTRDKKARYTGIQILFIITIITSF